MIYGFEWLAQTDRQLHYNNKIYENEYVEVSSNGQGFEWTRQDDEQKQYEIDLFVNKSFILSTNGYLTNIDNVWSTVNTTLPTLQQFQDSGMDDISLLDRKVQLVKTITTPDSVVLGEGKVFTTEVDLSKYLDLRKLEVK